LNKPPTDLPAPSPSAAEDSPGGWLGRITIRSVVAGVLLSLVISVGFTYTRVALGQGSMSADYITAGAICILFVVMALVNPCLKLVRRDWGFTQAELVVIYIMLIVASTIPTWGFSGLFVSMLPGLYYFATPENNWAELLHPLVKSWMVPQDTQAITDFYEGLPAGGSVPWGAWLGPLAIWCSFIIAIYLMMIAAMVLVRRQWVEHERLAFPLVQLPMEMTETGNVRDRVGPFLKNPVMWAGFLVPFCLLSARGLHQYFPVVPEPDFYSVASLFRNTTGLVFNVSFTVIGFAYLLSLHVAVGFWFFHLLTKCLMGWQMMTGYRLQGDIERYMEGTLLVAFLTTGAMFALVAFGVWTARSHLREVWRKVVTGKGVDDTDEVLSYRAAVAILIVCGGYTTVWLHLSGLPMAITVAFLLVAFAIFVFMARLVAEGGLGFMMPPMPAQPLLINFAGTSAVTETGVFSLALSFSWAGNIRVLLMASAINAMKMAQGVGVLRRPLFWIILLAIVVSLVSSLTLLIWAAYEHGGVNLERPLFTWNPQSTYEFARYKIANPVSFSTTPDIIWPRALWTAIGGVMMAGLILLRHHFLWWPLHPLGFAVSASNISSQAWFSIFIGSLIKAVVLKYGGARLYHALRPFFLGLILGQIVCAGVWLIIDLIAGGTGNRVTVFMQR
jgi:hypothetical protein